MGRDGKKKISGGAGPARPDDRAAAGKELEVQCPCCRTRLQVDAATGIVLREDRPKKPQKSFETALHEERERRAASDELFGKALASERNHQAVLDRKFEKALEKAAEEPDERPKHPLDWD